MSTFERMSHMVPVSLGSTVHWIGAGAGGTSGGGVVAGVAGVVVGGVDGGTMLD